MSETPPLYLRRAHEGGDVDLIYRWRSEVVAWLAERYPGIEQWRSSYPRSTIERWVVRGETYMAALEPDGPPVATVTSSAEGDPELWTAFELTGPARYLSKLTVDRRYERLGIGAALIDWTRVDAVRAGAETVRIDVFTANERLHRYYLDYGFRWVRTVVGAPYNSGALFEISAAGARALSVVELFDPFAGAGWKDVAS